MKKKFLIIGIMLFLGCDSKTFNPPPKIEIELNDNTEKTTMVIYYKNHSNATATLDTPEKIRDYRKEVEFLLNRLDEAEKKMKIHEPDDMVH